MEIYTIGFSKKSAREFFEALKQTGIKILIDVRLNNTSQLAGFTKKGDLEYFLQEISDTRYYHMPSFAPTKAILDAYKKKKITWEEYENQFIVILDQRKADESIDRRLFDEPSVLLCSETEADHCHRRLVAEYLRSKWGNIYIIHL